MRAVVQRVSEASVAVEGEKTGAIGRGVVVLLGVGNRDTLADVEYMAEKVANLRIFPDDESRMNRSLVEVGGEALVVSQFTIYGDCRKGRRPSFTDAASPDTARELYEAFAGALEARGVRTERGVFRAHMDVALVNDGPVTLLLDSERMF
jgi:D-tyrosyl-tRNA(Tyr) deacylase